MDSHSDGQIDTDDEYLNRLRNKTSTYQAIDISKSSAKRHGDTAVVNARAHCGLEFLPAWLDTAQWSARSPSQKWQEVITMGFGQSGDLDRLREATGNHHPFGTPEFVAELEAKTQQHLRPRKRGRPRRQHAIPA